MKEVIKKSHVRAGEVPGLVGTGARARCTKSARLVVLQGRARAVELTCSCGERTVLELVYEDERNEEQSS
jgi:hypothetical protein